MCSRLGTTTLAAQSVLLVSSSMTYQAPFAASVAVAVRVGNLLGASLPSTAALSARTALLLSVVIGFANSSMFLIFRSQWGGLTERREQIFLDSQELLISVSSQCRFRLYLLL